MTPAVETVVATSAPPPALQSVRRHERPPVGNTGSLFFTADVDTPASITRHLFEPAPLAVVEAEAEESSAQDLPLPAGEDKAGVEGPAKVVDQDGERSA